MKTKIRGLLRNQSDQGLHSCYSICTFMQELFCGRTRIIGGINCRAKLAELAVGADWRLSIFVSFLVTSILDLSIPFLL